MENSKENMHFLYQRGLKGLNEVLLLEYIHTDFHCHQHMESSFWQCGISVMAQAPCRLKKLRSAGHFWTIIPLCVIITHSGSLILPAFCVMFGVGK